MLLGCIADDYTGASDLANTLTRCGMRTVQFVGIPETLVENVDAGVIALKSRSISSSDAVRQSLNALEWLRSAGCTQILFKYCSTFDSTPKGNIGPVAEALLQQLQGSVAIACPAFPENKRTVYNGHLFVGEKLLHESGMENHPVNPMRDANLVRVLQEQTSLPVELLPLSTVVKGAEFIAAALREISARGPRLVIVDAISNDDLSAIGAACADAPLITGGSGIALGLPENFRKRGKLEKVEPYGPKISGRAVVLSGSCSQATLKQVAVYCEQNPYMKIDIVRMFENLELHSFVEEATEWVVDHDEERAPIIFSTAEPSVVANLQSRFGRDEASALIEEFFARVAARLSAKGVRRFIVAGGETSGAVIRGLGVKMFRIGREIDPGVPAMFSTSQPAMSFALKSGNFGAENFFSKAQRVV